MTTEKAFWLWEFLGRLHPLAVHFPVSLLLLAAILELFTLKSFQSKFRPAINVLILTGAVSAIISAIFGWLLYQHGDYNGQILKIHQYLGFIMAGLSAAVLGMLYLIRTRGGLIGAYRIVLFTTAIGVSAAGHFGASLTHGDNFLSSTLPWDKDYEPVAARQFNLAAIKSDSAKLTKQQEMELNTDVRAIFAHNCYQCHGAEKMKGDLRLDGKHMAFKGGEDGAVILPGNASNSELYKRISLAQDDKHVMPGKGKKLSSTDIALIQFWINKGAPWPDDGKQVIFRVAKLEPRNPALPAATSNLSNPVDLWTNKYFAKNNIKWANPVNDHIYLKRIYLDIIGLVPAPSDFDRFANDTRANKRELWVRELLNRKDDYAMHWLSFWNDALRNDYTGTGYITGGRFNITNWLYQSLRNNKPYDQFVKELISPTEASKGFVAGIRWRGVVNASQKNEMQAAQNVSQVFLGLNLKCNSCHNSFISDWKLTDAYAFANVFADSTLEINRCDKPTGKYVDAGMLWKQLGTINSKASSAEKQRELAENLVQPADGRLYRTIVNRIWAQMMGRGIVEPVDVMDNAPWDQDLLDWMAFNFVANKADLKELIYQIATSRTYQLPSVAFKEVSFVSNPNYKFRGMLRKRMSAEQLTDAVSSVISPVFVENDMKYNPIDKALNKDNVKYPFVRASLVANNEFLTALGRPNRETVATSRDSQANLLQALELTNGERLTAVLKQGAQRWQGQYSDPNLLIKELYSRALGRLPSEKEFAVAKKSLGMSPNTDAIQDLFWAVVVSPEFQIIY
ncbi:PSD1 and planctomycete cytochrome C domain-containing protein [Mucilaginibacter sp. BJC16-A38]|uniref:PSD1 and planctomycete cytochrome C domain-containing protein n=1 Tax=Mucilaginibacter phenanthrenivorans TaxID=1234842 RepID=UPI002157F4BC|nr:PSD1 and planctomycete cytochrome C domain-containing protein [Mucilaginibacter phenanthrenivorans]MCR8558820.1 PSD1 and planctomycete cytochrome C domain-containing protein [Mucilaginibacter phenanthrenivorans]